MWKRLATPWLSLEGPSPTCYLTYWLLGSVLRTHTLKCDYVKKNLDFDRERL